MRAPARTHARARPRTHIGMSYRGTVQFVQDRLERSPHRAFLLHSGVYKGVQFGGCTVQDPACFSLLTARHAVATVRRVETETTQRPTAREGIDPEPRRCPP
jgi:hypothetical protein